MDDGLYSSRKFVRYKVDVHHFLEEESRVLHSASQRSRILVVLYAAIKTRKSVARATYHIPKFDKSSDANNAAPFNTQVT